MRKIESYMISSGFDRNTEIAMRQLIENIMAGARDGFVPQGGISVAITDNGALYTQAMVRWAESESDTADTAN